MSQGERLAFQVPVEKDTLSAIPTEKEEQAQELDRDRHSQPHGMLPG